VVVDALPRRHTLLVSLDAQILGFDNKKELYEHDRYFSSIFVSCSKKPFDRFYFF